MLCIKRSLMARRKLAIKLKKNKLIPLWIVLGVVAIFIGVFLYRGARSLSGNPILTSQDDVPRLSAAEAIDAIQNQGAILLDTRAASQYEVSHIEGALNVPLEQLESYLSDLEKETWYITYCT